PARHSRQRHRAGRHRGAAAAHSAQHGRAERAGEGLVPADRRPDRRFHADEALRQRRRAGRRDPVPGFRRGQLHHRRHPAGGWRGSGLTTSRVAASAPEIRRSFYNKNKRETDAMRKVDVHPIIDNARFSGFHWLVMCLCALLLIFDGYDLFIYGVVLPVIMQEWGLTPLQAGALGSYALFGMMFGALIFGTLADRIGRKKGIAICFLLFSGATVLNGFASTPTEFGIFRFLAGLGCGGLMPNVVALMNEYAPKKLRSTLVAIMFSGYPLGGMFSAGLGIYMLPRFGWEAMFFAAAVPLLLLPVILWKLPESVGFLVRQGRTEQARKLLNRIDPSLALGAGDELVMTEVKGKSASVLELFRDGRGVRTLSIWIAFFCCLLMVYALGSWLPKLMANAGYSLGSSLSFLVALNLGGMFGAIIGG